MRTTLTLDDDVARLVADEVHRTRRPLKHVVNDALRRALTSRRSARSLPPYRVVPHDGGRLLPGIDPGRLNQLVDELEVEAFVAEHAPSRPRTRKKATRR